MIEGRTTYEDSLVPSSLRSQPWNTLPTHSFSACKLSILSTQILSWWVYNPSNILISFDGHHVQDRAEAAGNTLGPEKWMSNANAITWVVSPCSAVTMLCLAMQDAQALCACICMSIIIVSLSAAVSGAPYHDWDVHVYILAPSLPTRVWLIQLNCVSCVSW